MAGTVMTPGGTTGANLEAWKRTIDPSTYQQMVFIPMIEEGPRPFGQATHRKFTRVSGSTLGQSDDGTGLTYLNILGTPATITPVGSVVPIAWSRNERAQIDVDLSSGGRTEIEGALAELTESNTLLAIASLTLGLSVADLDGPTLRRAQANLIGNTNGKSQPGKVSVYGIFSHTQLPNLQSIEEYNRADVRGGSETPYVTGVMTKGSGILINTSTVVSQDANGWHNALFLREAFAIDWNERSTIVEDSAELQERLIAYNNVGSGVIHNSRAFYIRTTNNPL